MKKRLIRVIGTLAAGWLLYSMTGTIPMSMSIPLPDFLHIQSTSLKESGYTEENALKEELGKQTVQAGAFDDLQLFVSGNAQTDSWFDAKNNKYRVICTENKSDDAKVYADDGGLLGSDASEKCYTCEMDADSPSNVSYPTENAGWLSLKIGELEYLVGSEYAWPSVSGQSGAVAAIQDWKSVFGTYENIDVEKLGALLERQTSEKITPRELAALLQLYYRGYLLGWYPEEHTMIVKMYDGNEIKVVQTNDGTYQSYENLPYSNILAISHIEIIGYDENTGEIMLYRFTDGMTATLLSEVQELKQLNYKLDDDAFVLGGLLDSHTAFIYNCTTKNYSSIPLGDDFDGKYLIFGQGGFLVVSPEEDGTFKWKRGAY